MTEPFGTREGVEVRRRTPRKEIEMRPYIICHMLSSVDGKIDGGALKAVMDTGEYETLGATLKGDAWICGRTTMQQHFAEGQPFVSASNRPAGPQPVYVARRAKTYAISIDTLGKLRWSDSNVDGDHLICIVRERVPEDYLAVLRDKGISYIVSGDQSIDLVHAVNRLGEYFGIRTLLLEGGGHINGAFLQADLIDEVSLLVAPGNGGRHDIPAVFDGVGPGKKTAVPLRPTSVERLKNDALWVRYEVIRGEKQLQEDNNAEAQ
jgi:2,5-diamino-6-(ribosylamino)-4(3H)-pyrimidinone 5'-phosphate reductase